VKIKITALAREKRVYYFNTDYGVLRKKATSWYHLASGLMVVTLAFGVLKAGALALDNYNQSQKTTSYQRQSAPVDLHNQSDGESDEKLKNAPTKAREDEQLAEDIKDKLKNVPGGHKWSVYVRDLNSDRMASIDADDKREAAGLGHLFTTVALEAKTPTKRWSYRVGGQTINDCVYNIISFNDEKCLSTLSRYADLKNANSVLSGHGFKKTNITPKEKETTARETGDLLFRLQNSQVLSDKARRVVFDGLYGNKMREGIAANCKDNCLTANIAGESGSVRHDAAIVTIDGAKYVVVIMAPNSASWSQIADVAAYIQTTFKP
jgi:Beta-lactamase enzyme family